MGKGCCGQDQWDESAHCSQELVLVRVATVNELIW